VTTNHSNISKKGREAGGRIARWAMALSKYNYQIEYFSGKSNLIGDALSCLVAIETKHIADGTRPRQTAESASPFPEVHSEIAWQASQGLLELDISTSENTANEANHFWSQLDARLICMMFLQLLLLLRACVRAWRAPV
jgi:hypothetical protein